MREDNTGEKKGDLSVTALYTSQAWAWGGFRRAELFSTAEGRAVFGWTNAALRVARLFVWSLVSLKHSLVHRHALIDRVLERSGIRQVLELAAGLSRRGAAFSDDAGLRYVEVDLPHVVERKRALLERSDAGREVAARSNWRLVAGDVTAVSLGDLVEPGPRFVIAEGLCMYLKPDEQRALWRRVADLVADGGGIFAFDLVPWVEQPKPGLVGRALEWLMKRFTKGATFARDERTRDDIRADLRAAGFARVDVLEPCVVAREWDLPFPDRRTRQLVFVCHAP